MTIFPQESLLTPSRERTPRTTALAIVHALRLAHKESLLKLEQGVQAQPQGSADELTRRIQELHAKVCEELRVEPIKTTWEAIDYAIGALSERSGEDFSWLSQVQGWDPGSYAMHNSRLSNEKYALLTGQIRE